MRLASADAQVKVWNNQVLKLDETTIGLKGSPTWVSRIFSPEREKGEIIGDGLNDPAGTARLMLEKLLSKDLLPL
jgi:electron transfer flavoprotein beta subunit